MTQRTHGGRSRHAVLAAIAAAAFLAIPAAVADAVPGPFNHVGLVQPYTFHPGCGGGPIDPINVVWFGNPSVSLVSYGLEAFVGWTHNDNTSPFTLFGTLTDHQATEQIESPCVQESTHRADDTPLANRNHVRLFRTTTSVGGPVYVVGDAHHDQNVFGNLNCTTGEILPVKHKSSDFNGPRDIIYRAWAAHGPGRVHKDFWGNTRRLRQCDGTRVASDGNVAVMRG